MTVRLVGALLLLAVSACWMTATASTDLLAWLTWVALAGSVVRWQGGAMLAAREKDGTP